MTFININVQDWVAVFYIVKWMFLGFVLGVIIMEILNYRKKKPKNNHTDERRSKQWRLKDSSEK